MRENACMLSLCACACVHAFIYCSKQGLGSSGSRGHVKRCTALKLLGPIRTSLAAPADDDFVPQTRVLPTIQVRDLTPLSGLTCLEYLSLPFCTDITDITPLRNLHNLRFLDMAFCTQVRIGPSLLTFLSCGPHTLLLTFTLSLIHI